MPTNKAEHITSSTVTPPANNALDKDGGSVNLKNIHQSSVI